MLSSFSESSLHLVAPSGGKRANNITTKASIAAAYVLLADLHNEKTRRIHRGHTPLIAKVKCGFPMAANALKIRPNNPAIDQSAYGTH